MSYHDFIVGRRVSEYKDVTFYGVIQAAMRLADDFNVETLKAAFPETWNELRKRYNAPGGLLIEDAHSQTIIIDKGDLHG